jgi:spore maturation protein SpmB
VFSLLILSIAARFLARQLPTSHRICQWTIVEGGETGMCEAVKILPNICQKSSRIGTEQVSGVIKCVQMKIDNQAAKSWAPLLEMTGV